MDIDDSTLLFGRPSSVQTVTLTITAHEDMKPLLFDDDFVGFEADTDQVIPFREGAQLWEQCSTPCEEPEEIAAFDPDAYPLR